MAVAENSFTIHLTAFHFRLMAFISTICIFGGKMGPRAYQLKMERMRNEPTHPAYGGSSNVGLSSDTGSFRFYSPGLSKIFGSRKLFDVRDYFGQGI